MHEHDDTTSIYTSHIHNTHGRYNRAISHGKGAYSKHHNDPRVNVGHVCKYVVCMHVYIYIYIYVCKYGCMHVYVYVCTYVFRLAYARVYGCMYEDAQSRSYPD